MLVGSLILIFISTKKNVGAHGQESMNFCPEEYDAGASPSALKRLGEGQLKTQRVDLKLF
jgi:hypothetical protein